MRCISESSKSDWSPYFNQDWRERLFDSLLLDKKARSVVFGKSSELALHDYLSGYFSIPNIEFSQICEDGYDFVIYGHPKLYQIRIEVKLVGENGKVNLDARDKAKRGASLVATHKRLNNSFDILAVCMFNVTRNWLDFAFIASVNLQAERIPGDKSNLYFKSTVVVSWPPSYPFSKNLDEVIGHCNPDNNRRDPQLPIDFAPMSS
jgi:hypothetical protein